VTAAPARRGHAVRLALGLAIGFRVLLTAVGMLSVATAGPLHVRGQWAELVLTGRSWFDRALAVWQRWDALWYQRIVQQGYRADDGSTAFFPLYPLGVRTVAWLLGGRVVIAELLLSSAAFAVAMVLLHRLVRIELERARLGPPTKGGRKAAASVVALEPGAVADTCVWAIALFPVAFFFHAPNRGPCRLVSNLRRRHPWPNPLHIRFVRSGPRCWLRARRST